MRLSGLLGAACAFLATAALCAVPAAGAALTAHTCTVAQATPASYTWDFKAEANQTLKYIRAEAGDAAMHADTAAAMNRDGMASWFAEAEQLDAVKSDVNAIESKLCRLETIRRVLDRDEQQAIDQIATSARLMANNLEDDYAFGNANGQWLWSPSYQRDLNNLYGEAHGVAHSARISS